MFGWYQLFVPHGSYLVFVPMMINNSNYSDVPMSHNIFASDSESGTSESDTAESVYHSSD